MKSEHTPSPACQVVQDISLLSPQQWNACAHTKHDSFVPFIDYHFLHALEKSGSVGANTGWHPCHLAIHEKDTLIACSPMYLKSHSQGEYVFDHGWADALERAGESYYPKLQISVPFTPAACSKLLSRDDYCDHKNGSKNDRQKDKDAPPHDLQHDLLKGSIALAKKLKISSLHATFLPKSQWNLAGACGFLQRTDQQFHWQNHNYANFDAFLETLSSRKRKNIVKERRAIAQSDITIERHTAGSLQEHHWDAFYQFYQNTGLSKWGVPYLTRQFFSRITATMARHIVLIMAKRQGHYIAGALNFVGSNTIFGRHWGCLEKHRHLHFELCYYQAMDYAIEHNIAHVEAGAQGMEHKLARGYTPMTTYSAHYIAHEGLHHALKNYLHQERSMIAQNKKILEKHTPFRKDKPLQKS